MMVVLVHSDKLQDVTTDKSTACIFERVTTCGWIMTFAAKPPTLSECTWNCCEDRQMTIALDTPMGPYISFYDSKLHAVKQPSDQNTVRPCFALSEIAHQIFRKTVDANDIFRFAR